MSKRKYPEFELQSQLCQYIQLQYPDVLFLSDAISNINLRPQQAVRLRKIQKHGFNCPDLLILEPRGGFKGLFIELKVITPYKINGRLKKSNHLDGQAKSIKDLTSKGYYSLFSWGFDRTRKLIDDYMALPKSY